LVDKNGRPFAITSTVANGDERKEVEKLLQTVSLSKDMIILEADRGYDCSWLRQALLKRGIFPLIPHRKMSARSIKTQDICKTFNLQPQRWKVERAFSWLKRKCRRLLMRWERLAETWLAFNKLGLIYLWTEYLFG